MSSKFREYIFQEFQGKGEDGEIYKGNFQVYLLSAGNIEGSILLTEFSSNINIRFDNAEKFSLVGELKDKTKFSADNCVMYSLQPYSVSHSNFPMYTARFIINRIKIVDEGKLKNLPKEKNDLFFTIGVANYYSINGIQIQTDIGSIRINNILSQDEIIIFRKSFIPFISSIFEIKINNDQKNLDTARNKVIEVITKILELTSFALTAEHRWVFMKVYLNNLDGSTFLYSEINNTIPKVPDSHANVNPSELADFLNKSYNNYNDEIKLKYNFSLALKWYLDSLSLRYDVMKYISASISFESMLDSAVKYEGFIVDRDTFKHLRLKLEKVAENELRGKILSEDLTSLLASIGNINRRSYRSKAEKLLASLDILDDNIKSDLRIIIKVRDRITHSGRFMISGSNGLNVIDGYWKLFGLLTRIFFKILGYKPTPLST